MSKNRRISKNRPRVVRSSRSTPSRTTLSIATALGVVVLVGLAAFYFISPEETQTSIQTSTGQPTWDETSDQAATEPKRFTLDETRQEDTDLAKLPVAESPAEPELTRMTGIIRSGDSTSCLLEGHLNQAEIYSLCDASKKFHPLSNLKAGQPWTMIFSQDALVGLEYEIDDSERLIVSLTESGYEFCKEPIPYEIETKAVSGSIDYSLFGAMQKAGESDELAIRLANIFAYDIDFVRDLRSEDSFKVVVDKRFRDGKFYGYSDLKAASFTNQGKTYYAFQYTDSKGNSAYYDQDGRPLRKAFLRAPLTYTARISSGYTMSRMHPILKYRRPHQGIDYAAPTGTPISTVADGTIAEAAFNKSQGRYVRVVHSNGYETIYNHMSKLAKITKKGARVKQGQVIGYVGSTGYATGPHLDYRMKHNGKLINPLTIKSMPAEPIEAKQMPAFKAMVAQLKPQVQESIKTAALLPQTKEITEQ